LRPTREAPRFLVEQYNSTEPSRHGQVLLRSFLEGAAMAPAWTLLARRLHTANDWRRLWGVIVSVCSRSKKAEPTRSERREQLRDVEKIAEKLRKACKRLRWEDRLIYEVLPGDVVSYWVPRDAEWSNCDSLEQAAIAERAFSFWPSLDEVLVGLKAQAAVAARSAMEEPRVMDRTHAKTGRRTRFIRLLQIELKNLERRSRAHIQSSRPWLKASELHTVIARIAATAIADSDINETLVAKALMKAQRADPKTKE